jgi:hypothetical protein
MNIDIRSFFLFLLIVLVSMGLLVYGLIETNKQPGQLQICELQENIYCQRNIYNEFNRTFYVKSDAASGMPGQMMLMSIAQITGVEQVYPSRYKFSITISPVYHWDDVEPEVIERIVKFVSAFDEAMVEAEEEKEPDQEGA